MFNEKNTRQTYQSLLSFVGREKEIKQIIELLSSNSRLITITGMGGIGKSVLAQEIAIRIKADQGIKVTSIYYEDSKVATSEEAIKHFLNQAGWEIPKGNVSSLDALMHFLGESPQIVILDACEQAGPLQEWLGDLLIACPTLKILATSRVVLGITGETHLTLNPLVATSKDISNPSPASQLFIDRARLVNLDLAYTPQTARNINLITKLVDGLPLAIEIVASLAKFMSLDDIIVLLKSNIKSVLDDPLLGSKSLMGILDNMWLFASSDDKKNLSCLCIFETSFSFDAALAITDSTIKSLQSLLHHSLLLAMPNSRLQIHALVREYVRKITTQEVKNDSQKRLTAYYLNFAKNCSPEQFADMPLDDFHLIWQSVRLASETGNENLLREALENFSHLANERGRCAEAAELLSSIRTSIYPTNGDGAHLTRKLKVYEAFLSMQAGLYTHAVTLIEDIEQPGAAAEDQFLQGRLDLIKGQCYAGIGSYTKAENFLLKSLNYSEKTLQYEIEVTSLLQIAMMRGRQERVNETFALLKRALQITIDQHLPVLMIETLINLSVSASDQMQLVESVSYAAQAREIAAEIKNQRLEATAICSLGTSQAKHGKLDDAIANLTHSRQIFHDRKELRDETIGEFHLAMSYLLIGSEDCVNEHSKYFFNLSRLSGFTHLNGWMSITLAINAFQTGNPINAKAHLDYANEWGIKFNDTRLINTSKVLLAELHIMNADYSQAHAALDSAQNFRLESPPDKRISLWFDVAKMRLAVINKERRLAEKLCERIFEFLQYHSNNLHCRPAMAYLHCYQTLVKLSDSRADEILDSAVCQINNIAKHITNLNWQKSFLQNIPENAELLKLHALVHSRERNPLTDRQKEVLEMLALGYTNQEIANSAVISFDTAKKHVNAILDRLGAKNRTSAVKIARDKGYLHM